MSVNRIEQGRWSYMRRPSLERGCSFTRPGDDVMYIVPSCSSAVTSACRYGAGALSSISIVRSKCELIS